MKTMLYYVLTGEYCGKRYWFFHPLSGLKGGTISGFIVLVVLLLTGVI